MKSSQICTNFVTSEIQSETETKKRGKPETSISSGCSRHLASLACKNKLTTYHAMSGSRRATPFFLLSVAKAGAGIPQRFFWNEDGSHRYIIHHCLGVLHCNHIFPKKKKTFQHFAYAQSVILHHWDCMALVARAMTALKGMLALRKPWLVASVVWSSRVIATVRWDPQQIKVVTIHKSTVFSKKSVRKLFLESALFIWY